MRALTLILTAILLGGCTHQGGVTLNAPAKNETATKLDSATREQIAFYETADVASFVAECAKTGKWRLLSCVVLESQFTTFPGLTQAEVRSYIVEMKLPHECIDYYGLTEGILGGSLELRSKLRDVREAYATRVNRAVVAELEKRTSASNTRN